MCAPSFRARLAITSRLTVALSLAPFAVGPPDEHGFITRFLSQWGGAGGPARAERKRRKRRSTKP
jgi:hypothetical protein